MSQKRYSTRGIGNAIAIAAIAAVAVGAEVVKPAKADQNGNSQTDKS